MLNMKISSPTQTKGVDVYVTLSIYVKKWIVKLSWQAEDLLTWYT